MQKKFEYKILDIPFSIWSNKYSIDIQATLNQLGLEGWELVSTTHANGMMRSLVFKRELIR